MIDTVGFNEGAWMERFGMPHTDRLHTIERVTRLDFATMDYEVTIDDPGAYTKPFTVAWDIPWRPNADLAEYICQENNLYLQRLKYDFGQPVFGNK